MVLYIYIYTFSERKKENSEVERTRPGPRDRNFFFCSEGIGTLFGLAVPAVFYFFGSDATCASL